MPKPGVVGIFRSQEDLLAAVADLKAARIPVRDAHSPYPVPGLAAALGLKHSRLGWVTFLFGVGAASALVGFEVWVSAVDWPLNVGGKPDNSLVAFAPPAFEFGVLFASLATVAAMLWRNGLFPGRTSGLDGRGLCNDRFALVVEAKGPEAERILKRCGAEILDGGEVA